MLKIVTSRAFQLPKSGHDI